MRFEQASDGFGRKHRAGQLPSPLLVTDLVAARMSRCFHLNGPGREGKPNGE